jgi:hypothetical protein
LLEIVVTVGVLATALIPLVSGFTSSIRSTDHVNRRALAIALTNTCLERYRGTPFDRLAGLFGDVKGDGSEVLSRDPLLRSDLAGPAFSGSLREYRLEGRFEVTVPGQLGLLTFTCHFPTRTGGPPTSVHLSGVVVDYTKIGWGFPH